jgi:nitroimidazol reductase NimA-like FMN-containing flavoprotein (pyridoxamine 5'-phosphate oxidase superfamily)
VNASQAEPPVSLSPDQCWALLASEELGHFATSVDDVVDIFPINYVVHDETILFKTGPGSKLENLTANHTVAFEADGRIGEAQWSVVVHGSAERLAGDPDIEGSGLLEFTSWMPGDKWNYVRISPSKVTGVEFRRARAAHES